MLTEEGQFIYPWRINSSSSRGQNPDNLSTKSLTCYMWISCFLEFAIAKEVLFKSQNQSMYSKLFVKVLSELWALNIWNSVRHNRKLRLACFYKKCLSVRRHWLLYSFLKIILNVCCKNFHYIYGYLKSIDFTQCSLY